MAKKRETSLQSRLQKYIEIRGGYVKKNHGNMITQKGLSDLWFTYRGLACHWEVKTPEDSLNVSVEQGIHCRLAKKAGGITAIITSISQADYILNLIDLYLRTYPIPSFHEWAQVMMEVWDDGTTY